MAIYRDRRHAGRVLANALAKYAHRGVPVAFEVATTLGAPLDVFVVRKLGVPGYPELAMGAIASSGVVVLNREVVEGCRFPGLRLTL
jgi:putative phosphoribosyl transferase